MKMPDAIVLAGGLGTRLGKLTRDTPKPMLPLNGRPFLEYVLEYLCDAGVERTVLSIGYQKERIHAHFGSVFLGMKLAYCEEEIPLGTGGAILKAISLTSGDRVLVTNGDTYFPVDIRVLQESYSRSAADVTMALKAVPDASRYGRVMLEAGRVVRFLEKGVSGEGLINGGTYMLRRAAMLELERPPPFSFERDVLEKFIDQWRVYGVEFDVPFVDIGVPQDYLVTASGILPRAP